MNDNNDMTALIVASLKEELMSDFKAEILTEIKKMFQSDNRNNDGSDTLASHRVDDTISLAPSSTMSYREGLSKNLSTSGGIDHQRDL